MYMKNEQIAFCITKKCGDKKKTPKNVVIKKNENPIWC